jgi:hypothetical protein
MHIGTNMLTIIHISVSVIPWLSVNLEAHCIFYNGIVCYTRFVAHPVTKIVFHNLIILFVLPSDLPISQQMHYFCLKFPLQTSEHFLLSHHTHFLSHHIRPTTQPFSTSNLTPIPPTTYSHFTDSGPSYSWRLHIRGPVPPGRGRVRIPPP